MSATAGGRRRRGVVGALVLSVLLLLLLLLLLGSSGAGAAQPQEPDDPHVVVFYSATCPHCRAELEFLEALSAELPELRVVAYEVSGSVANRRLMTTVLAALGHEPQGVPTTIIGEQVWVGFGEGSAETLRRAALHALDPPSPTTEHADPTIVDVPLVGGIDVTRHSLLVATAVIALVDGFNPCSLWALSILLALVLNTRSRRRVAAVGLTFLAVTTILYGVYIIGLYSVLSYVGYLAWIRVAVAALAITFGIINVKDYFAFGRGPSLTISARRKPQLYQRMRYVADPDRPLLPVLGGTAALAVGVSLLETPCTAGFPVLWADLLAEQGVAAATAVALFAVYMVVFLVDELLVLAGAIVAMRVTKMTERHGRLLKLVGGVVMLTLAAVLLFAPQLMESIAGALVVFLAAALVTVAVVALTSRSSAATKQGSRRVPSG